jgi:flagellar basal body-associated protein FliL
MNKIIVMAVAVLVVTAGAFYYFVLKPVPQPAPITFSPGDYFVTNVKDSNRLLKTTVVLVIDNGVAYSKLPVHLEEHISQVRDTIIFILRELNEEEIRASGVEESLRKSIRLALNEKLATEGIKDILFNDFVMQ